MSPRILVAGIGNIFRGDDGFGVEVANRLANVTVPESVKVEDFGIRGVHLAYELLDGYDMLILIDALPRAEEPGTVFVFEPDLRQLSGAGVMDAHTMDPGTVLSMLADLGGHVDRVLIVGCEPARVEEEIGFSDPVAGAVEAAARLVVELVNDALTPVMQESR